ncbi:P2Y purinoceptor 1-like [Centroberyx affinis]|uniref:P2Y purinoceptor 1-like n=1 Tax=Centroberyx affinis TaxID=166261 RepID=UPI003A5BAC0D
MSQVLSNNSTIMNSTSSKTLSSMIEDVIIRCQGNSVAPAWTIAEIVILIIGSVANAVLLWLFLKERKSLSASKVLGLNLVVMNLLYLLLAPVSVYSKARSHALLTKYANNIQTILTSQLSMASDAISMLNLIGSPLLLTCMCVERFVAVVRPVLYLRLRRWEYRMAVSAVVWPLTLLCCLLTAFSGLAYVLLPVSIILSCLFQLMLGSLGGVVWSLWRQSPAHTHNDHAPSRSHASPVAPVKRRAVGNVLAVVLPAVVSYLPVVLLIPIVFLIPNDHSQCNLLEWSVYFPKFGLLIGPMFYLAKARQMLCFSGGGKGTTA